MGNTVKYNGLLALGFGLYSSLVLAFLDPFRWIDEAYFMEPLIFSAAGISVLAFLFFQLLSKAQLPLSYLKPHLLFGLLVSPILIATTCFFWFGGSDNLFLFCTSFILLSIPPIAGSILWSLFDELKHKIRAIGSGENEEATEVPTLKLTSDQGKVFLEVSLDKVLCFEANDNYVITHFLNDEAQKMKSMDRISLKKISESVRELNVGFQRVHKSFLINPKYVKEIKGRSQAYKILLDHHEQEIPVSRNFDISIFSK